MSHKTRIEKLEQQAPAPAGDGDFIKVITWEGPSKYFRLVDGERIPCSESDIPKDYFSGEQVHLTWDATEPEATP